MGAEREIADALEQLDEQARADGDERGERAPSGASAREIDRADVGGVPRLDREDDRGEPEYGVAAEEGRGNG